MSKICNRSTDQSINQSTLKAKVVSEILLLLLNVNYLLGNESLLETCFYVCDM